MRATRLAGNGVAAAIRVAFAIPAKSRAAVLHNRCPTASLRRATPSDPGGGLVEVCPTPIPCGEGDRLPFRRAAQSTPALPEVSADPPISHRACTAQIP